MAMKIDSEECIDCGACVDPCPNNAIFPGGESYELNGQSFDALSDKQYIVWEKCTECVGHYDNPQCAENCPVDCISKDPEHEESEDELKVKAEKLNK